MDGTSPGGLSIVWGAGGTQWWNPQTGQWQAEMPPPSIACAANPPPTFVGTTACGGSLHPFRTGTLLTQPQDGAVGDPTNGGDFARGGATACVTIICGACGGKNNDHQTWCNMPRHWSTYPAAPTLVPPVPPHTHFHLTPAPPLSDADIERIARRVVELLDEREAKP